MRSTIKIPVNIYNLQLKQWQHDELHERSYWVNVTRSGEPAFVVFYLKEMDKFKLREGN